MDITLRTNKGSALTYDEMDRNLAQFYFSSSLANSGATLRLHYTGSNALDTGGNNYGPRYTEIALGTSEGTGSISSAAGSSGNIQYKERSGLGANSTFTYDTVTMRLGLGTAAPLAKLEVTGDTSQPAKLRLTSTSTNSINRVSTVDFYEGATIKGFVGRADQTTDFIYVNASTGNKTILQIGSATKASVTTTGFGVGTSSPTHPLTVVGKTAIGSDLTTTTQGLLGPNTGIISAGSLPASSTTAGLVIESPVGAAGGHIIVGLNTTANSNESFSVVRGITGTYSTNLFTVKANGNIGIGNQNPTSKLTVAGAISGSGALSITGNATIGGTVTVGTIPAATTYSGTLLTVNGSGQIQSTAAAFTATVPIGGIIIWSGAIASIPTGWKLCNGANGTPDLRNRFIVGAGTTYSVGTTGGSANAVVVAHTHTGTTDTSGGHTHTVPNNTSKTPQHVDTTAAEWGAHSPATSTVQTGTAGSHNHIITLNSTGVSGTNANLPPYYALAYIMYTG